MILVTVGTGKFDELVRAMDELAPTLGEPVVCQIGRGAYVPRNGESFRFAPSLEGHLRGARVVVGHGGLGTVMAALRLGRPFVGVSNPSRPDRHQDQILGTLEARGHLVWCCSLAELRGCIARAGAGGLRPYAAPPCRIPDVLYDFLLRRAARAGAGGRPPWRRRPNARKVG